MLKIYSRVSLSFHCGKKVLVEGGGWGWAEGSVLDMGSMKDFLGMFEAKTR